MAWLFVVLAGFLEIAWALGLKSSEGFTRFWPSVWTIVGMIASFVLLARGLREIPVGTGYAVWTGIGAAGTAIAGMMFFGEAFTIVRCACIALILIGIIGLKVATSG